MAEPKTTKTHDDARKLPPEPLPMLTDAEAILALNDLTHEWVDIPEWHVRADVWSLTGTERDRFELSMVETRGKTRTVNMANLRARLVAASIRQPEETSKTVFSPAQVSALGAKNAAALQRVFRVAQRLSGLADDEVEELTAELGNDQSGASGSA